MVWSTDNAGNLCEVKEQAAVKVMVWVGIVNGRVLPIHWFDGNVTADPYLKMLKVLFGQLFGGKKAFGSSKIGPEFIQLMKSLISHRKSLMGELFRID